MKNFFYRVKKGDTVTSVSLRFNIPVGAVISANGLKKEPEEGDILFLEIPEGRIYLVKPEDTLKSISEKFGVKEEEILLKNKVPYLFAGEIIEL